MRKIADYIDNCLGGRRVEFNAWRRVINDLKRPGPAEIYIGGSRGGTREQADEFRQVAHGEYVPTHARGDGVEVIFQPIDRMKRRPYAVAETVLKFGKGYGGWFRFPEHLSI
ncbi:MAG: hypothetical protein COA62_15955 [Rhodobiaceae bacterium]|nr:MAG: hypothetical protein COA62_15955 [Rhodobiaceae bacterium]